jgi:L-ascorbate metabolism protein UlaG (beta-lactamase superfamily)
MVADDKVERDTDGVHTPNVSEAADLPVWATWIGQSTILLRLCGTWVLTDPVLFDTYGLQLLGLTLGPRRLRRPALALEDIPKPDLILLSHAHMDHMDRRTLRALAERHPKSIDVITTVNTGDVIDDLPWHSINEMDWGDRVDYRGLSITGLRVKHNGWRIPGEACRAEGHLRTGRSYNGYHIDCNGVGIVFGGDTAYTDAFKHVRGDVELAFMPIGAYHPYPETHCTPEEALDMSRMMKARRMIPIHHSTFKQSEEPLSEPLQRLRAAARSMQGVAIAGVKPGESVVGRV